MKCLNKKKRYDTGGVIPYDQLGMVGGSLVDSIAPVNQYGARKDFAAGLSGGLKMAGTGASIGATIGGPLGAGIGAVGGLAVGAVKGIIDNNKIQQAEKEQKSLLAQMELGRSAGVLRNYDQTGSNTNQIYAKYGGSLKKLSSDSVEVQGNSHEEGGVSLGPNIEVEDNETIKGDFVYSDALGYARQHKKIATAIGKMEKKEPSNITNQSLKRLKERELLLQEEQEATKEALGLTPLNYKYGGKVAFGNLGGVVLNRK